MNRTPYSRIEQVPVKWRAYRHGRLTLPQINKMVDEAESASEAFPKVLGRLREALETTHEIVDGFWVLKAGDA